MTEQCDEGDTTNLSRKRPGRPHGYIKVKIHFCFLFHSVYQVATIHQVSSSEFTDSQYDTLRILKGETASSHCIQFVKADAISSC